MKNIISFFFFLSILGISTGFYFKSGDEILGNKIIGTSVTFMVFVFMPLFIYDRWKDKKLSDYTFSDENLKKMKAKSSKSNK
ncbi:hypothetical protein N9E80_01930 [Flavobacteriaceae bacterium]|jgi:hypothetical protein|nr:hypothetical protein [Flavobacteriaceae bacterium]MDC1456390.1 hypothetical protein [Flavobacteriaceae bacterium]|tara:strand:+ start:2331 stop:2576 length:246 start_codon:yes stop_codon:yes gene_type:complete